MDTLRVDVAVIGAGTAGLNARREVEKRGGRPVDDVAGERRFVYPERTVGEVLPEAQGRPGGGEQRGGNSRRNGNAGS